MSQAINHLGQPVGHPLKEWAAPKPLSNDTLEGPYSKLEALEPARHGPELYKAFVAGESEAGWTYLPYGPFSDEAEFQKWLSSMAGKSDPAFFAIIVKGMAVGLSAYLRIQPTIGSVEIGHLHFSPLLQRTAAATEALYLMIRRAFESGYRRCEWKCDSLNEPSRHAALRLGFTYEGIFRQAAIYKGRNRDTAWFSIIDQEWPQLECAFKRWLDASNFDASGIQRRRLLDFRAE